MSYPSFPGAPNVNAGFYYPRSGLNNTIEYIASGLPFSQVVSASSTVARVDFPMVTNELYIKNRAGAPVSVGWTENGVQGENSYTLADGEQVNFRMRVRTVFFYMVSGSGPVDCTAGLTQISHTNYPNISGAYADPATGEFGFMTGSADRFWGWDGTG